MPSADLATVAAEEFEGWQGQDFRLEAAGGAVALSLVEVRRGGESGRPGGAFALTFRTSPGPFLPQAMYLISHPEFGSESIFIVPIGREGGGNAYEAVFA